MSSPEPLAVFFDRIRSPLFGGRLTVDQVSGIERILAACKARDLEAAAVAYVLATSHHETGRRMQPVREGFATTDARAVAAVTALYKRGRISVNYALPDPVTGRSYYGRGDVQLTWKRNYKRFEDLLGIPLVDEPDRALDPKVSATILVEGMTRGLYTGKALGDYVSPAGVDFEGARRVVNGTDKAKMVAGYADKYLAALRAAMLERDRAEPAARPATPATAPANDNVAALAERVARLERILEAVAKAAA